MLETKCPGPLNPAQQNMTNQNLPLFGFDRLTMGLYLALVSVGWLMIYAVTYSADAPYSFLDMGHIAGKQLAFMVFCLVMMFVIMLADWAFWRTLALPLYIFSMLLLPGTLLFGREVNGANAWYHIGGFTFQPSEIAKFGTCLAMAAFLSSPGVDLRQWRDRIIAFGIFLIPTLLVLLQSDTGSALLKMLGGAGGTTPAPSEPAPALPTEPSPAPQPAEADPAARDSEIDALRKELAAQRALLDEILRKLDK